MWAASLGFCSVDYQVFVSLLLLLFGWFAVCAASFEFCSVGCLFGVLQCGLPVWGFAVWTTSFFVFCFVFCFVLPCGLPVWGFALWAASVGFSVCCQFWVLQCIGCQFWVLQCVLPVLGFAVCTASFGFCSVYCQFWVLPCVLPVLGTASFGFCSVYCQFWVLP